MAAAHSVGRGVAHDNRNAQKKNTKQPNCWLSTTTSVLCFSLLVVSVQEGATCWGQGSGVKGQGGGGH